MQSTFRYVEYILSFSEVEHGALSLSGYKQCVHTHTHNIYIYISIYIYT